MYKVFLNTEGIIEVYNEGPKTPEEQQDTIKQMKTLCEQLRREDKRVLIFDDVSKLEMLTEELRKVGSTIEKLLDYDKFAFFSNDLQMKIMVDFMIKGGGQVKTRVFKDKEEALAWLKS